MEDRHRDVIRKNWIFLLDNVILDAGLTDHLFQDHVLSQDMIDTIESKCPNKRKVQEFFNILMRRGPEAFDKFISALNKTGQEFIAQKLIEDLNVDLHVKKDQTHLK